MSIENVQPSVVVSSRPTAQQLLNAPLAMSLGFVLVMMISFVSFIDLETENIGFSVNLQLMTKLAVLAIAAIYGTVGFIAEPKVRNVLFSFPGFWIVAIIGCFVFSCLAAIDQTVAVSSTCILIAVTLTTVTTVVQIGRLAALNAVFAGCSLFIIGSWAVYLLAPSMGVYMEPLAEGEFRERMSGLAYPNTLAQIAGLTVVLGIFLVIQYQQKSWFQYFVIALAVGALAFSISRTSTLAVGVALVFGLRHIFIQNRFYKTDRIVVAVMMMGLFTLVLAIGLGGTFQSKVASLTKSNDIEELTTATGRTDIWAAATNHIMNQPLTGYGAGSSKYLLKEHNNYTHNLVLNVALSTGIVGGLATLFMIFHRLNMISYRQNIMADSLIVFILVNGVFENVIFSIVAGTPTIVWVIALTWWSYQDEDDQRIERVDLDNGKDDIKVLDVPRIKKKQPPDDDQIFNLM